MTKIKVKKDALAVVKATPAKVKTKMAALLEKVDQNLIAQQARYHESDMLTLSKGRIAKLEDAVLLADTITVCNETSKQMGTAIDYLRECQKRFDNRGKGRGERVVAGYKGWSDFCERGLGRSIRSVQRRLMEAADPIARETRKADARIHARAAKSRLPGESANDAVFKERFNEHFEAERNKPKETEAEEAEGEILDGVLEPSAILREGPATVIAADIKPSVTVEQAKVALARLSPNIDAVKDQWYAKGGSSTKDFPVSEFVETLYATLTIALKAVPVDNLPAVKTELLVWIRDFDYWTKAMKKHEGQGGQHENGR
jgi:hypothetical protein